MMLEKDIENWLPHTPPMLMISKIVEYTDKKIKAISCISENNPLLQAGRFPNVGAIELFAQTAGILFAMKSKDVISNADTNVPNQQTEQAFKRPGAVIQLKSFELGDSTILPGCDLSVTANYMGGSQEVALMNGTVYHRSEIVFNGSLMIALFTEGSNET